MANNDTKKASGKTQSEHSEPTVFNYPEHGISVEASSREEADQILQERLESLKEIKAASDGAEDAE